MALVTTEAVVLHAFDYMESSRIYRVATREFGVQSVLAKGARRARGRVGTAVDLFAQGEAQLYMKPGRDLHNLATFDVTHARPALVAVPGRFTAAAALAELVLRFVREESSGGDATTVFDSLIRSLDAIAAATADAVREVALAGAWRLVAELGFAPTTAWCSVCRAPIAADLAAPFSYPAGGALCLPCARTVPISRTLPPRARAALGAWLVGADGDPGATPADDGEVKAHQRLLREFVVEHLTERQDLRAFAMWEHGGWDEGPS